MDFTDKDDMNVLWDVHDRMAWLLADVDEDEDRI
jgi:hypothetical protein